jgi:hypothetical protein
VDPTAERKCQRSGQGIEVPAGQLPGKHVLIGGCLREDGSRFYNAQHLHYLTVLYTIISSLLNIYIMIALCN